MTLAEEKQVQRKAGIAARRALAPETRAAANATLCARLAAAQALMPQTPIILDDALIRFDDRRLEKAVELLKELGKERQILLFSCQGREERKAR